jgi:hypothetical protein
MTPPMMGRSASSSWLRICSSRYSILERQEGVPEMPIWRRRDRSVEGSGGWPSSKWRRTAKRRPPRGRGSGSAPAAGSAQRKSRFRRCHSGGGVPSRSAVSHASAQSSSVPDSPVGTKNASARGGLLRKCGCGQRSRNSTGDEAGAAMAKRTGPDEHRGPHSSVAGRNGIPTPAPLTDPSPARGGEAGIDWVGRVRLGGRQAVMARKWLRLRRSTHCPPIRGGRRQRRRPRLHR